VESPAKAKTIEKYLGKGFSVRASVGHIRDLPKSNKDAVDVEGGFVPRYQIVAAKQDIISGLQRDAKKADEVILATDPDREGEAIAWHLAETIGLQQPKRIVFNEITERAVQDALAHPRDVDMELVRAQEARRVLDRLFGYDLSGLIWKKVRYGLSAGRVQSPALRILMEREREIRAFVPEAYWVLEAELETKNKKRFTAACVEEPKSEKEAEAILTTARAGAWSVKRVEESEQERHPRPPFTTSTLQQAASTRLGFSPARTMRIAQKLYEAGHITYMRTDSPSLAASAQANLIGVVKKEYGEQYLSPRQYKTKSRSAQEAHEAVRPTDARKANSGGNEEQKRLYQLIRARAIASQMSPARAMRTKLTANIAASAGSSGVPMPDFAANGSRIIFDGWLKADPAARGEEIELPKVAAGDPLSLIEAQAEGKETQPPPRYSEAGLVRELEKRGIGRPSTYASIIKTLEDRGYVEKEGRTLMPTHTGDVVSSFIEENFGDYISDTFTAEMEDELDEIADGKRQYEKTLKDFYGPFRKAVKGKEKIAKLTGLGDAPPEFSCPICGGPMEYKLSKSGRFMSCKKFPDCLGARAESGEVMEKKSAVSLGAYPPTGEPVYVLEGRFGPFVQAGETPPRKTSSRGPKTKPKRASIPKDKNPGDVTLEDALKYLALPRELGAHPETGKPVSASIGRFGPYIVHDGDFRSLKQDDVYTIELPRALQILKEPKKRRGFRPKRTA